MSLRASCVATVVACASRKHPRYCNVADVRTDVCPICERLFSLDLRGIPGFVLVRGSEELPWVEARRVNTPVCVDCMIQRWQEPDLENWPGLVGVVRPQFMEGYVPITCEHCGTPCFVRPDKGRIHDYCSLRCQSALHRQGLGEVVSSCAVCGKEITRFNGRRYCSQVCRQRAYQRR